jgi:hypothetical protein
VQVHAFGGRKTLTAHRLSTALIAARERLERMMSEAVQEKLLELLDRG